MLRKHKITAKIYLQQNVKGKQETLENARTIPVAWTKQAKEEQTCLHRRDTTVSRWHRYSKQSIPDREQEAKEEVLQNHPQYPPGTDGNCTFSQTDSITYGIRLCPLASVDLFQKSVEQPPEIQALQKKERGRGQISRPDIHHVFSRN